MGKGIKRQKNGQKLDHCFIFSAADMASIVNSQLALTAVHQFQKCWMEVDGQSMCHMCRRHATPTQAQVRLHWTTWRSDLSSVSHRRLCLFCRWGKGVERPAKRRYVGLVAVVVQEQAEDILVLPLLRNCLTFPFPSHYLPPQNSGPCNSFYCLGHFKNVDDDDDDTQCRLQCYMVSASGCVSGKKYTDVVI